MQAAWYTISTWKKIAFVSCSTIQSYRELYGQLLSESSQYWRSWKSIPEMESSDTMVRSMDVSDSQQNPC